MGQPIRSIPNGAVNFESYDYSCMCRDQREVECIKAEKADPVNFQVLASECTDDLVVGGNFPSLTSFAQNWDSSDTTDTGTTPTGWTFSGIATQMATHVPGMTNYLQQNGILSTGFLYKVTFTVKRVTNPALEIVGSVTPYCGTTPGTAVTASGTYTQYITATGTQLKFLPSIDFDGALDDIECVQMNTNYRATLTDSFGNFTGVSLDKTEMVDGYVQWNVSSWSSFGGGALSEGCYRICITDGVAVGGCSDTEPFSNLVSTGDFGSTGTWGVGTNWSIGGGVATHAPGASGSLTQTLLGMTSGLCYTIVFNVKRYAGAGTCNVSLAGTLAGTISASGIHTFVGVIPNASNDLITFAAASSFDADIDDVSVTLEQACYPKSICSQCFDVKTTHNCSKLFKCTNNDNAFGFDYTSFTTPLEHVFRANAYLHKWKYIEDSELFTDSQGASKTLFASFQKEWELFIAEQPEWVHDFFAIMRRHDTVTIDGDGYFFPSSEFSPELEDSYIFGNIRVSVRKTPDLNLNKNCSE